METILIIEDDSTMPKCFLALILIASLFIVTGCVSIPQEKLTLSIDEQELSDHVHFLAQKCRVG